MRNEKAGDKSYFDFVSRTYDIPVLTKKEAKNPDKVWDYYERVLAGTVNLVGIEISELTQESKEPIDSFGDLQGQ